MFDKPNGAFTGEISVEQLEESNIQWALVGHSERRVILQEDDNVSFGDSSGQSRCLFGLEHRVY